MSHLHAVLCLTPLLWLGCASAPPPRPQATCPAGPQGPLQMTVQVQARVPGAVSSRPVLPGEEVRSGEELSLSVWLDAPAHVYAMRRDGGRPRRLHQDAADRPMEAGEPVRIPQGGWIAVGEDATATFQIAASTRPLWESAPEACARLALRCRPPQGTGRGDEEPDEPPPPPPGSDQPDRGPRLSRPGEPLRIAADPCGVALATFSFPVRRGP